MTQAATNTIDLAPIAPAATAIDRGRLAHMTFGDRSLERELLQLFDRQAGLLIARMRTSEPKTVASLAHTLKGSALGVGATSVARAAAAAEFAATLRGAAECGLALDRLGAAVDEARATIAALLRAY
jgi:HPt (histidine-containing phosphotransfer) domain-containing protein